MSRLGSFLLAVGLFAVVICGCESDPVKKDVISYSTSVVPIIDNFDYAIGRKLDEVGREEDKQVFVERTKAELLPLLKNFRERIIAVKPATTDVQAVHKLYVDMVTVTETGMNQLVEAIEKHDRNLYHAAMEKIGFGQDLEKRYKVELKRLAAKHQVIVEK